MNFSASINADSSRRRSGLNHGGEAMGLEWLTLCAILQGEYALGSWVGGNGSHENKF